MTSGVPIGEFSRLCHLTAKTLRHYHDIALLVPAAVDAATGYRRYSIEQVGDAHLIRRLRELDMPLAEIRQVLVQPDTAAREETLSRHLDRMEAELTRTRDVVTSLRRLLNVTPAVPVTYRRSGPLTVLRHSAQVARPDLAEWFAGVYPLMFDVLAKERIDPAGAAGATFSAEFFERDEGEVAAFIPVAADVTDERFAVLPAQRFAVAMHSGPFTDFDLTYGHLGSHVAEHDTARPDPIVEVYLVGPDHTDDPGQFRTEICWPVQ